MRNSVVLVLFLSIFSATASFPVKAETIAVNQKCSSLGASLMATDQKNVVTCLKDDDNNLVWKSMNGSDGMPSGTIAFFVLASCPSGWALADGTNGTVELRGEFIRVLDSGRGIDSGRTLASAQSFATSANGLKLHVWWAGSYSEHSAAFNYGSGDWAAGAQGFANSDQETNLSGKKLISSSATETRPRNVALLACQKL